LLGLDRFRKAEERGLGILGRNANTGPVWIGFKLTRLSGCSLGEDESKATIARRLVAYRKPRDVKRRVESANKALVSDRFPKHLLDEIGARVNMQALVENIVYHFGTMRANIILYYLQFGREGWVWQYTVGKPDNRDFGSGL